MTVRKKVGCLATLSSALFLLFILVTNYSDVVKDTLKFFPITNYPTIDNDLPKVIFWLSVTIFCLILVTGIIVILSPITKKNLLFVSSNGTLNISRRSIENYVLYTIINNPIIFNPQIEVHITKKMLKIKILGYMTDSKDLIGNSDQYALQVQEELNQLLGDHKMKLIIDIKLKDYEQKAKRKHLLTKQRVE